MSALVLASSAALKRCTTCRRWLPSTREFFFWASPAHKRSDGTTPLVAECIDCKMLRRNAGRPTRIGNRHAARLLAAGLKTCPKCSETKPMNSENYYLESDGSPYGWCRGCMREARLAKSRAQNPVLAERDALRRCGLRRCPRCQRVLPDINENFRSNQSGSRLGRRYPYCRDCTKDVQRDSYQQLRATVLNAYGKVCANCGEQDADVITIDHVNNDGAAHRREIGDSSSNMLKWLIGHGFPDDFQLLCRNCNWKKHACGGDIPMGWVPHPSPALDKEVANDWILV